MVERISLSMNAVKWKMTLPVPIAKKKAERYSEAFEGEI